jgi:hypothetical protein
METAELLSKAPVLRAFLRFLLKYLWTGHWLAGAAVLIAPVAT